MVVVPEWHFQPQVSTNIPVNTISYTRGIDLSGGLQGLPLEREDRDKRTMSTSSGLIIRFPTRVCSQSRGRDELLLNEYR
ncbi:MAG: hypothetical protein KIS67_03365 [Verrucomicrobiae bacterium]|nr:hypothetical protein [Verrucomicrobiae bacterium]